jgi:hypothetical protein
MEAHRASTVRSSTWVLLSPALPPCSALVSRPLLCLRKDRVPSRGTSRGTLPHHHGPFIPMAGLPMSTRFGDLDQAAIRDCHRIEAQHSAFVHLNTGKGSRLEIGRIARWSPIVTSSPRSGSSSSLFLPINPIWWERTTFTNWVSPPAHALCSFWLVCPRSGLDRFLRTMDRRTCGLQADIRKALADY